MKIALTMIPSDVMSESRAAAKALMSEGKPANWIAAVILVGIWLLLAGLGVVWMWGIVE